MAWDWDLSQYVIVEDPFQCVTLALEASRIERQAMRDDRGGRLHAAMLGYRRAAVALLQAVDVCPEGHPDRGALAQHAETVSFRADYLESHGNTPDRLPLEAHIRAVQLTIGVPAKALESMAAKCQGTPGPHSAWKETKVMRAAAVISGATGLLALGPMSGIALGAATAYATTREDKAGSAARKVGAVGVELFHQAKTLNRDHNISQRMVSVTAQTPQVISSFNKKHRVAEKLAWGFTSATSALSTLVSISARSVEMRAVYSGRRARD